MLYTSCFHLLIRLLFPAKILPRYLWICFTLVSPMCIFSGSKKSWLSLISLIGLWFLPVPWRTATFVYLSVQYILCNYFASKCFSFCRLIAHVSHAYDKASNTTFILIFSLQLTDSFFVCLVLLPSKRELICLQV